jgi:hypothetical protein
MAYDTRNARKLRSAKKGTRRGSSDKLTRARKASWAVAWGRSLEGDASNTIQYTPVDLGIVSSSL